jgi:hypothetical protein
MDRPDLKRQFTKYTAFRINTSEKVFYALAAIAVPFAIMELIFCCWYSLIWGHVNQYSIDDWQYALLAPQPSGFDEHAAQNHTTMSFASYAGKVFVFFLLSFKATLLGIKDPEFLPYSVFSSILVLIGMTVFRDATPVQPTPKDLTASLPSIWRFVSSDMYCNSKFNMAEANEDSIMSQEVCDKAYRFNFLFVLNNLVLVGIVLGLFCLSLWGLFTTKSKVWANPLKLKGNVSVLILGTIVFVGYLLTLYAKELSAQSALQLLEDVNTVKKNINYLLIWPFSNSKMDPVSVTMLLTLGSIGIGTCKAHLQNFKLAAVASFIHIAISYPTMLATFFGYLKAVRLIPVPLPNPHPECPCPGPVINTPKYYNLWSMNQVLIKDGITMYPCTEYVMDSVDTTQYFIDNLTQEPYPYAEDVATGICTGVHYSFIGQSMIFIALHLIFIVCLFMTIKNQDIAAQMTMRRYESFFDNQDEDKNGGGLLGMSKGGDTMLISHNGIVTINPGLAPVMTPHSARTFLDDEEDIEQPLMSGQGQN